MARKKEAAARESRRDKGSGSERQWRGGRGEKKIITDEIKEKFKNVVLGDLTTTQLMELNKKTPLNMV